MTRTWYTADLHLDHARIIELCDRPFADVGEMNEAIVERWNSVVGARDTVWLLGDVALSMNGLGPVARLKGRKILVAGNHDSCWDGHKKWRRHVPKYLDAGFDSVITGGVVDLHRLPGGIAVRLAHLPYQGDSQAEDRYADRRPVDDGLPLICGHVHNAFKTRGKQLNVGVDVHDFYPAPEDLVIAEVRAMYTLDPANPPV